jgi:hypothetical protein
MALNLVNARTGVSSWVKVVKIACRVSHLPRFRAALQQWVGETAYTAIVVPWDVFCAAFELYQESDDSPFTIDNTGGEPIDTDLGA